MSYWLILVPLVSALLGWILTKLCIGLLFRPYHPQKFMGFTVQGIIPHRMPALSVSIADLFSQHMVSSDMIEQKILDPATLEKITPEIEQHIDYFLRVKLKDAIPMVAMFVGDKTIIQLKEVFMKEMQTLFPEIMKSYVGELKKDTSIREKIIQKLTDLPPSKIESFVSKTFIKEFRYVEIAGTLMGLIIGVFQAIIILMIVS